MVDLDARGFHRLGLRNGARKSVEQKAPCAIGLGNALFDEVDDEIVADKLTRIHHRLGLYAQRSACLDGSTQHIARGDLRNAVFLANKGRLRAFASTRCAKQNEFHGVPHKREKKFFTEYHAVVRTG